MDFWWLKPMLDDPNNLNPAYLSFHDKDPTKNDSSGVAAKVCSQID